MTMSASCPISIHAPREGSDSIMTRTLAFGTGFLSTLPARGATGCPWLSPSKAYNFYPRSPRGERQVYRVQGAAPRTISIHAPREGSDA